MLDEGRFHVETLDVDGAQEVLSVYSFLQIGHACLKVLTWRLLCTTQSIDEGLIVRLSDQGGTIRV